MPPATAALLFGLFAGSYTTAVTFQLGRLGLGDDELPRTGREWARLLFVVSVFLVNPALFLGAGFVAAEAAPGMLPALVGAGAAMIDLLIGAIAWVSADIPPPPRRSAGGEGATAIVWVLLGALAACAGAWLRR